MEFYKVTNSLTAQYILFEMLVLFKKLHIQLKHYNGAEDAL
jgi:hypothetical protein